MSKFSSFIEIMNQKHLPVRKSTIKRLLCRHDWDVFHPVRGYGDQMKLMTHVDLEICLKCGEQNYKIDI